MLMGSRKNEPSRGDLWDLGQITLYLCCKEKFFEKEDKNEDDLDYEGFQRKIDLWLAEWKSCEQTNLFTQKSISSFKKLPLQIQTFILNLVDYQDAGSFRSWAEV